MYNSHQVYFAGTAQPSDIFHPTTQLAHVHVHEQTGLLVQNGIRSHSAKCSTIVLIPITYVSPP